MSAQIHTVEAYIDCLPEGRRKQMTELRNVILGNLPKGFAEVITSGMIGYVVPHSLYPPGYRANPLLPLPFINIASQKNYIAMYHLGLYADEKLLEWFTSSHIRQFKRKPDMGKSCIRFTKPERMPLDLLGELVQKLTVSDWIDLYEGKVTGRS